MGKSRRKGVFVTLNVTRILGAGEIRTKRFRHTYCAAALQLLDRGAPVSPWTVAKWMGHGGRSLVDRIYGHLGDLRHRSEVVEFRVEQDSEALS